VDYSVKKCADLSSLTLPNDFKAILNSDFGSCSSNLGGTYLRNTDGLCCTKKNGANCGTANTDTNCEIQGPSGCE
jgi:hypothetical protein